MDRITRFAVTLLTVLACHGLLAGQELIRNRRADEGAPDVPAQVEAARALMAQGDLARAIETLDQALRRDPESADARWARGSALFVLAEHEIAFADLQEAKRLDRRTFEACYRRGTTWFDKGNYRKAIADFDRAIHLNPSHAGSYASRGWCWYLDGNVDRAMADYDVSLRLDPRQTFAYCARGIAWLAQEQFDKAIADFTAAIRVDPVGNDAYVGRGRARLGTGEYREAIEDLNFALRANPRDADAYGSRGYAWSALGHSDKAIADYSALIRLDSRQSWAFVNRGLAWSAKRDFQRATQDFTAAIHLEPQSADVYYARGNAWMRAGSLDKAIEDFDKAIELNPEYADAFSARGDAWNLKRVGGKARADYAQEERMLAAQSRDSGADNAVRETEPIERENFDADSVVQRLRFDPGLEQILLPVIVNGQEYLFVLDTGCTLTALDSSLPLGKARRRVMGTSAAGQLAVSLHAPPAMSLGSCRLDAELAEVAALDLSPLRRASGCPIYGLIGMDFLGRYAVHIDLDHGELLLLAYAAPPAAVELEFSFNRGDIPTVNGGVPAVDNAQFIIDTGFAAVGSVTAPLAKKLIEIGHFIHSGKGQACDLLGTRPTEALRGKMLRVGALVLLNPELSEGGINILGCKALAQFNITFDFPRRRMYLQPRATGRAADLATVPGIQGICNRGATLVNSIDAGSTAERFGLRAGDVLVDLDNAATAESTPEKLIARFTKILRTHPALAGAYRARGDAWAAGCDYDRAIADYDAAIRLDPKLAEAHLARADAWRFKGEMDTAVVGFRRAQKLDAKLAETFAEDDTFWQCIVDRLKSVSRRTPQYVVAQRTRRPFRANGRFLRR